MSRPVPLAIAIRPGDTRAIHRQIVDAVRRKISAGELGVGDALPSVRALAAQLTINPNTVSKAYGQLAAEGWVESRAGLGLFVARPRVQLSADERSRRFSAALDQFVGEVIALRYPPDRALAEVGDALAALERRSA